MELIFLQSFDRSVVTDGTVDVTVDLEWLERVSIANIPSSF